MHLMTMRYNDDGCRGDGIWNYRRNTGEVGAKTSQRAFRVCLIGVRKLSPTRIVFRHSQSILYNLKQSSGPTADEFNQDLAN